MKKCIFFLFIYFIDVCLVDYEFGGYYCVDGCFLFCYVFFLKKFNFFRVVFEWEVKGLNLLFLILIIYSKFYIII